ncbi:hypothetical protein Halru_0407 [Halovivax ruber XH-70]|uniref:Uncharacterized protein n=1 Tax=Halovivax ruber (strain DSM 18193 / JCM 13892 / XH-70) TaxID=797302 RepID=L0I681_HALRX|nr:hypothetical protein [Halovivax ruber]AGB15050.1 hypothetical protein Halru_0407 [Halovivax ruber XH-70]
MAAQHHPTPRPREEAACDSDPDGDPTATDGEATADDATVTVTPVESNSHDSTDVAAAIERERLRARIRALERELVASERHRQALVERYEWVLAERESDGSDRSGTTTQPFGTVRARLRSLFPGR